MPSIENPTLADVIECIASHINYSDPSEIEMIANYVNTERETENETFTLTEAGTEAVTTDPTASVNPKSTGETSDTKTANASKTSKTSN